MKVYYTYAYLREDGTPYYVGKGCRKDRMTAKSHNVPVPPKERILILKCNLSPEEAVKHEIYMIAVFGRKDIGTGILRNLTNGGEGAHGRTLSLETRQLLSSLKRGVPQPWVSERMAGAGNPMKNPETAEKIRQARKKAKKPAKQKQVKSLSKPITAFRPEKEIYFKSVADASRELNIPTGNICKVLKGARKSAGGFSFSYQDEN
jgi:hypothetical protein